MTDTFIVSGRTAQPKTQARAHQSQLDTTQGHTNVAMLEKHFSPTQLADLWGFSARFVRELLRNERGVILIDRPEQMHKRGYATMRIPESVASKVYARFRN